MPFQPTDRLAALPPYLFFELDQKKRALKAAGHDVIDFGVGDPDQPTPAFIVEAMQAAVARPENHRYPQRIGTAAFREAVARYCHRRFGLELDAATEVLALVGSKEGLAHLPLAAVDPGRSVLVPDPGFPVYHAATLFAGGRPVRLPLTADNAFLPDLEAIPEQVARDSALLFINYPNNPTGAVATREFFARAVEFCRTHELLLCHDAAYADLYFAGNPPPSVLEIDGARDVAVETHTLSKTFNMTGWRVGFAIGNSAVLAALSKVKNNMDTGVFSAVQEAAGTALDRYDDPVLLELREMYARRAAALVPVLRDLGFTIDEPRASLYVWARVPAGYDSMRCSARCLDEADVVIVPGLGFGEAGREYVRFALTVTEERTREAVDRLGKLQW